VSQTIKLAGATLSSIDALAIGLGANPSAPFFSLGLRLMKGIALAKSCPLIPVSSLESMATMMSSIVPPVGLVLPVVGEEPYWAGLYNVQARGRAEVLHAPTVWSPERLVRFLSKHPEVSGFGEGYVALRESGLDLPPPPVQAPLYPTALSVAKLASLPSALALSDPDQIRALAAPEVGGLDPEISLAY
jgi:tRNA A37 threonylcarbamoyladenosine modification protein TsaB